jgi:hypothetical protein
MVMQPMGIALRWREEPFDCEFIGSAGGGQLRMYDERKMVRQEAVPSASAAHDRARELKEQLLSPRAKHA